MISYPIGTAGQLLVFSDDVLKHFDAHRQLRLLQREAGGQLFASLTDELVLVEAATGPRPTDRRGWTHYHPDRVAEQAEIEEHHTRGLHFIGDWHTHPEDVPGPSHRDLASMSDCFSRSKHALRAFVLAIVGRASFPLGLHVSLLDGIGAYPLTAASLIDLAV